MAQYKKSQNVILHISFCSQLKYFIWMKIKQQVIFSIVHTLAHLILKATLCRGVLFWLFHLFYRWENWGTEVLCDLPKFTQDVMLGLRLVPSRLLPEVCLNHCIVWPISFKRQWEIWKRARDIKNNYQSGGVGAGMGSITFKRNDLFNLESSYTWCVFKNYMKRFIAITYSHNPRP